MGYGYGLCSMHIYIVTIQCIKSESKSETRLNAIQILEKIIGSAGQRCTSCAVQGCSQRLTRLRVESAGVEEVGGEVDVDITEEKQHVASLPGSRPHV